MNGYTFSENVRKALAMAREYARHLGHRYVATEHILLALIDIDGSGASVILKNLSIDVADLRRSLGSARNPSTSEVESPDLPFTSRAKKALEQAMRVAHEFDHDYVGTEHILLGVLSDERGIAAHQLNEAGLWLNAARAEVLRVVGRGAVKPSTAWTRETASGGAHASRPQMAAQSQVHQTIVPMIHVPDVSATIEWYVSIGFRIVRHHEDDGEINWAKLSFGGSEIMVDAGGKTNDVHRREVDLYVHVESIDDTYARLKDLAQIVEPPHDTFYGMREFVIRDLNRFWITFGSPSSPSDS